MSYWKQDYPDILHYISDAAFENLNSEQEWIYEYLNEYKKSKLSDNITDQLKGMLLDLIKMKIHFINGIMV